MWCSCLLLVASELTLTLPSTPAPDDPDRPIMAPAQGVRFSKWLPSDEYHQLFNENLARRFYPAKVEGKQGADEALYRARFVPRPQGLGFYSYHGMTTASYSARAARFQQLGYRELSSMSFLDAAGVRRHCATWIRDKQN
ncbi:MAG: hypothetical protein RIC55_36575 [Pirellulaceae bacterium]